MLAAALMVTTGLGAAPAFASGAVATGIGTSPSVAPPPPPAGVTFAPADPAAELAPARRASTADESRVASLRRALAGAAVAAHDAAGAIAPAEAHLRGARAAEAATQAALGKVRKAVSALAVDAFVSGGPAPAAGPVPAGGSGLAAASARAVFDQVASGLGGREARLSSAEAAASRAVGAAAGSLEVVRGAAARTGRRLSHLRVELSRAQRAADRATARVHLLELAAPAPGLDIPSVVLAAYRYAAARMAVLAPACHLSWPDIAALGRIESGQAQVAGTRLAANGDSYPPVLGPPLDGTGGNGAYPLPATVTWDGAGPWERAVGPLQFLPTTWQRVARHLPPLPPGVPADPNNVYAAALGAGIYLCDAAGPAGMASLAGIKAAYFSYNHSAGYVREALANAVHYGAHITPAPSLAPPAPPATGAAGAGAPPPGRRVTAPR